MSGYVLGDRFRTGSLFCSLFSDFLHKEIKIMKNIVPLSNFFYIADIYFIFGIVRKYLFKP